MLWWIVGAWLSSMVLVVSIAWLMARDGYRTVEKGDWESILLFSLIVAFAPLAVIGFSTFVLVDSMRIRHILPHRRTAICKCGAERLLCGTITREITMSHRLQHGDDGRVVD